MVKNKGKMNISIPETLYHYCSLENFFNIIKNKRLWLSDALSCNDYLECQWINSNLSKLIAEFRTNENQAFLDEVIQHYNINNNTPFISCFSEEGDLLSQWRGYAQDGYGVSIGFNLNKLDITNNLPCTMVVFSKEHSICIQKVVYNDEVQYGALKSLFEKGLKKEITSIELAIKFRQLSCLFKNQAFQEEKEWRIIHLCMITSNAENKVQCMGSIGNLNFRVTPRDIIPYFELPFDEKISSIISEVKLGPKNSVHPSKILNFLGINGYPEIKITKSTASYR